MKLSPRIYIFAGSVFFVLIFQLAEISRPFTGHFASYQTVMASMARNMHAEKFTDLLHPKTEALIAGKKSLHLNQYPAPSVIAAVGVTLGGAFEFWGRFQAVFFNLVCALLVFCIGRKIAGDELTGVCSAIFYLFSPLNLIYGQMFMSEPIAQFFWLSALFVLLRDQLGQTRNTLVAGLLFSAATASRLHFAALLPFFSAWIIGFHPKPLRSLLCFISAAFSISGLWYGYTYFATHHLDNVHTSLFMQMGGSAESSVLFLNPEFWRRILKFFGFTLLTPAGAVLLFLSFGLALRDKVMRVIVLGFVLTASIALLLPQKFFDHDFYLFPCAAFGSLLAAAAGQSVLKRVGEGMRPFFFVCFFLVFAVSGLIFAVKPVFTSPQHELEQVRLAKVLASVVAPEEKIAVIGNNAPVFNYYVNHPAWYLDLSSVGKKVESYMMHGSASQASIAALEMAMSSPVRWLEYLEQSGARTLVLNDPDVLLKNSELSTYIRSHYASRQDGLIWER